MPADAYTVRAVIKPGRSMDNEAMPRAQLVEFLHRMAEGLELNPDAELVRLTVSAAPGYIDRDGEARRESAALKALVALMADGSVRAAATPEQLELARAAGWRPPPPMTLQERRQDWLHNHVGEPMPAELREAQDA